MMFTEEEAKQTACCKELAYLEDGRLVTSACLASGCMAWRWEQSDEEWEGLGYLPGRNAFRHGYCGLAGRPE